jgi:hypothetical protein
MVDVPNEPQDSGDRRDTRWLLIAAVIIAGGAGFLILDLLKRL